MTFRLYEGATLLKEGPSPLKITGITSNTEVESGRFKVARVVDGEESYKVDVPGFKTLPNYEIDINGTIKKGSFVDVVLDEDAYDDLTVKDANTIYKVYEEGGNPDEAAWFLGEQPVNSAKEGDTVVYGRNYAGDWRNNNGNFSGTPLKVVADGVEVAFTGTSENYLALKGMHQPKKTGEYTSSVLATLQDNTAKDFKFGLRFNGEVGTKANDTVMTLLPLQATIISHYRDVSSEELSKGLINIILPATETNECTIVIDKLKVEQGTEITTYTVAPEDVAIFTEATGGGAA